MFISHFLVSGRSNRIRWFGSIGVFVFIEKVKIYTGTYCIGHCDFLSLKQISRKTPTYVVGIRLGYFQTHIHACSRSLFGHPVLGLFSGLFRIHTFISGILHLLLHIISIEEDIGENRQLTYLRTVEGHCGTSRFVDVQIPVQVVTQGPVAVVVQGAVDDPRVACQIVRLDVILLSALDFFQRDDAGVRHVIRCNDGHLHSRIIVVLYAIRYLGGVLVRGIFVVKDGLRQRCRQDVTLLYVTDILAATKVDGRCQRREYRGGYRRRRDRCVNRLQIDVGLFRITADDTRDVVVGTGIHAELGQVAVAIALDGGRLAVGQHIQAVGDWILTPRQQLVAHRVVVEVGQHGVHGQSVHFRRANIVQIEVHPQRVVVGEQARIQISGVRCVHSLVLVVGHLITRHHRHAVVVDVCHGIHGPPFGSQLDTLEIVTTHVRLLELSIVVRIEGVELVGQQTRHIRGVALLSLLVIINELQVVVAWHDATLIEHHRTQRHRAVAMAVEGEGLRHLFAFVPRPYLHLQLHLADGRHDVGVFIYGIQLRRILRGVILTLHNRDAHVERPIVLSLV